ncbi:MotE family protein [Litchfieldia salsa]|uniref:Flagellar motility protein MotE, a chaperone for MotC folding n=1 Tax=Litchfieldia salsa TaxID=930152 RepID=A0A1H0R7C1_9BACI|nr:MotE family protein [Litchfieldia salsa]SDP25384.1 Flagellar motility protein MotE, a chaperone for MotC folding [Litchfieldia salsa]
MEAVDKGYSKIQSFFFLILIPILFTVILSLVLMQVAGINVLSHATEIGQRIPGISSLITDESEKEQQIIEERLNKNIDNLNSKLEEKEEAILELEGIIATKDSELTTLNQELKKLKFDLAETKQEQLSQSKTDEEMTKLYEMMTAKKAALIIPNLDDIEAKKILSSIKTDKLAAILEKMTPEDAARITKLLAE